MSNATKNPVVETIKWAGTVSGAVALIALFVPVSRELLESTGLWGWGLFAALLTLQPWIVRSLVNADLRSKEKALREEWDISERALEQERANQERELARASSANDLRLVQEWLQGWRVHGKFHVHLVEDVLFGHLPLWFVRELEQRIDVWNRDTRQLTTHLIAEVWEDFRSSAQDFNDKILEYMWLEDRGRGERVAGSREFMHIPPEWKTREPDLYQRALAELQRCRTRLEASMGALFRALHAETPENVGGRAGTDRDL